MNLSGYKILAMARIYIKSMNFKHLINKSDIFMVLLFDDVVIVFKYCLS